MRVWFFEGVEWVGVWERCQRPRLVDVVSAVWVAVAGDVKKWKIDVIGSSKEQNMEMLGDVSWLLHCSAVGIGEMKLSAVSVQ